MGKRKGPRKGSKPLTSFGSDEEDPDPAYEDYYEDEVHDFHTGQNKVLLDQGYKDDRLVESDEEEEVLNVVSDDDLLSADDDDDEIRMYRSQLRRFRQHHIKEKMDSDVDEADEDDGLPDSKAWGSKRSRFYHADVLDDKFDLSGSDDETGKAAMEEKEALAIQKKMAEELNDQDFGLDVFKPTKKLKETKEREKIVKDLSKLSKREKLELLKKESPELLTLIEDYISKMTEVKDVFQPLLNLVNNGKVFGSAADYVRTRFHLNMNYCINVSFYLMLKSKHLSAQNHPVVKRLVQYRNLMKQLEPLDIQLKPEIDDILSRLERGEEVDLSPSPQDTNTASTRKLSKGKSAVTEKRKRKIKEDVVTEKEEQLAAKKKKRKIEGDQYETQAEKDALEYYKMMKGMHDTDDEDDEEDELGDIVDMDKNFGEEEEVLEDGKRAITYQIAKNKGMTTKKKKELRNPRVKHRKKFEKAKVRRKGQVREARKEISPYGGELSGIRAGLKKSIKLK